MNIELLSSDLASRVPEMARDSVVPQVIQPIAKAIKSALNPFSEE